MATRYEVSLGQIHSESEHSSMGTPMGEFVISFTVEPPVKFQSEQAAAELGHHVLVAWNALGGFRYSESGRHDPNYNGNHALISFPHESADEDKRVTMGVVTGYNRAHPDHFERETLQQAFDIVLNGESGT